jgi:hypothetical protein
MIYSHKDDSWFRDRWGFARYQWRDHQHKPIPSWLGLDDCPDDDNDCKRYGLPPTREGNKAYWWLFWIMVGIALLVMLILLSGNG